MTDINQAYKYYTIIFIVSLPLPKDVKVMISTNTDAQTFYEYFVSLHNKSTRPKRVSSPLVKKIRRKSDLPRGNQNRFN